LSEYTDAGIRAICLNQASFVKESEADYSVYYEGKKVAFRTRPYSRELIDECRKNDIDMMIYTNAEREAFECRIPYLTAVLDWTHKTHPQFKEFTADGVYEQREYIINNNVQKGLRLLVDSETAKQELMDFYNADESRIIPLPFIPPPYLSKEISPKTVEKVRRIYDLPERFIFYPAQFWPHKNHENIVRALYSIKNSRGIEIPIVFVGSTMNMWSSYERVMALANESGIVNQIIYPGYVEASHVQVFYSLATALVIPTYPGPTNLPVLEAFKMECPVITSNIKALHEQVGDAGILVEPNSPQEIADAILSIWTDTGIRQRLIEKGRQRIRRWGEKEFFGRLCETIESCKSELL
jgi:glycosyltransferase involved in cell wall biosynthesis